MESGTGDNKKKMFSHVWEMADKEEPVKMTAKVFGFSLTMCLCANAPFDF